MTGKVQQGHSVIPVVLNVHSTLYTLVKGRIISRFEGFLRIMVNARSDFNLLILCSIAVHYILEFREETLPVPHATNDGLFAVFT